MKSQVALEARRVTRLGAERIPRGPSLCFFLMGRGGQSWSESVQRSGGTVLNIVGVLCSTQSGRVFFYVWASV